MELLQDQNFAELGAGFSQAVGVWKMFLFLSEVLTPANVPIEFSDH